MVSNLVDATMPIIVSLIGVIITVFTLIMIIRNLEAALFWSILLGPTIGQSIASALIYAFLGDYETAKNSLILLPFVLAPIDNTFFGEGVTEEYAIIGGVIMFLWIYVLLHYMAPRFGVWSIPMVFPVIYVSGLTLPNLRFRLATAFPSMTYLLLAWHGVIFLSILVVASFALVTLFVIKTRSVTLPVFPIPKLRQEW